MSTIFAIEAEKLQALFHRRVAGLGPSRIA
jgi:hypothetical protein